MQRAYSSTFKKLMVSVALICLLAICCGCSTANSSSSSSSNDVDLENTVRESGAFPNVPAIMKAMVDGRYTPDNVSETMFTDQNLTPSEKEAGWGAADDLNGKYLGLSHVEWSETQNNSFSLTMGANTYMDESNRKGSVYTGNGNMLVQGFRNGDFANLTNIGFLNAAETKNIVNSEYLFSSDSNKASKVMGYNEDEARNLLSMLGFPQDSYEVTNVQYCRGNLTKALESMVGSEGAEPRGYGYSFELRAKSDIIEGHTLYIRLVANEGEYVVGQYDSFVAATGMVPMVGLYVFIDEPIEQIKMASYIEIQSEPFDDLDQYNFGLLPSLNSLVWVGTNPSANSSGTTSGTDSNVSNSSATSGSNTWKNDLLYVDSNGIVRSKAFNGQLEVPNGGYMLYNSNSEYLPLATLNKLSNEQLFIARNEIFARHGRGFTNQDLQTWFNAMPWYVERYSPSEFDSMASPLNDYEKGNVDTILELEQLRNSPYIN